MSPELVDQTILACSAPQLRKVARIIRDVAKALKMPIPEERIYFDPPETFEIPQGLAVDFIADRIKALVKAKKLESAGNLDWWTHSEIRLRT
jgi:hypothetical protein